MVHYRGHDWWENVQFGATAWLLETSIDEPTSRRAVWYPVTTDGIYQLTATETHAWALLHFTTAWKTNARERVIMQRNSLTIFSINLYLNLNRLSESWYFQVFEGFVLALWTTKRVCETCWWHFLHFGPISRSECLEIWPQVKGRVALVMLINDYPYFVIKYKHFTSNYYLFIFILRFSSFCLLDNIKR